ncbi:hypothetical protein VCUG_00337 [Vavraia culicis subsp. floridensis]|uniref:Uncharacterized protein n=1 Tax=Vavraia culicis (isolate floridensis) TaxID=948595 RepID=L2GWT7_VAVCU|nr:uncharacterized protein VCUG_00337 [Vavraia culicis subsp. floridensis]ELA48099.1 hypothetical protein VCUG_00337 [Vavraia culicis subsp. floridensis]
MIAHYWCYPQHFRIQSRIYNDRYKILFSDTYITLLDNDFKVNCWQFGILFFLLQLRGFCGSSKEKYTFDISQSNTLFCTVCCVFYGIPNQHELTIPGSLVLMV